MARGFLLLCLGSSAPFDVEPAHAQAGFYQGKTMTYVVGSAAGDATDLWARAVTRNMGKYIPGNPRITIQNMPGARGVAAANYLYREAKPDGLTMGSVAPGGYVHQLFGRKKARFDWKKFTWVGSSSRQEYLLVMRSDSPHKTIDHIRAASEPPRCSAEALGSTGHVILEILEEGLGAKFKIATGYKSPAEQDLALERGEVQCRALPTAEALKRGPIQNWTQKEFVRVLVQTPPRRNSKLPEVPTIYELMDRFRVPEANRRVASVMLGADNFGDFPTVASPGIPPERIKSLRDAYAKALKEPDFLDEAKKRRWKIDYISGEELEALAQGVVD